MDHKKLCANSSESTSVSDGSAKFVQDSPTIQANRNKLHDAGSLGKVDATVVRPCAIIGPDRVLPPNPDDTMYIKKLPGESWLPQENMYRRPPDNSSKISDYPPTRNISPRQTFQENMQRIMVPPTFSSLKNNNESSLKNSKPNMPQESKYCDVPYNVNSVNNDQKSVRNPDIPTSNVNPYTRNVPPPYGWPASVNVRPLRPYGASEFYQYQDFSSCAGPRPMTMIRPHRAIHEESGPVFSERLYQDANIRFKPYPTGKEKHQQQRYDYVSNYPNTFHPPAPFPTHKYDLQKSIHGHPYPAYPQVPFKYLDRRIHEPFVDGYHRSNNYQANFNSFHDQAVPPPYGPMPGNCMQNKSYPDISSKSMTINKLQFENNNNKVYLNLESRNKNYSVPENLYYNDMNQAMRGDILLPTHSRINIPPMSQQPPYRKDNTPLKSYDYNPNYRIFDQAINLNPSLQRLPLQFSPNTLAISPSDSNTSNDTAHTIGTSQEDCGYVSQSSTASIRSLDSGNVPIHHDIYRRHYYNNYDMLRNTFHTNAPMQVHKNKTSSNKKNLNVRQFLQMWNEGDEEISESNKEIASKIHANNFSTQSENVNNQEQLYVLGLVTVPNEELDKYDHIQKISKLPENIKGYNGIEILNQYEELVELPCGNNYKKPKASRDYKSSLISSTDKNMTPKLPRPVSPLDVEAKISQSVIHKEVGCNFEIKPCSPDMLNVEVAAPVQTILGERTIEKVVNPLITKSPNLARSDNIKCQNNFNDTVKVASCEMINSQYSSSHSISKLKPNNYSVQDLESNAGICLASLPQLDNDIELNFPEINQQFIKANQIKSNISTALQNIPNMDVQPTYSCFPHEHSTNTSPQPVLNTATDKESSKLSKYRKGKKCELSSSHSMAPHNTLKIEESAVLQRVDSVIIKNPDTIKSQDTECIKLANAAHNDNNSKTDQFYSSSKFECNDFISDTAIDFSLNRTEAETSNSYLNASDKNITEELPQFEELTENHKPSFVSCDNIKSAETKYNTTPEKEYKSIGQTEALQSECFQTDISEVHEQKQKQLSINSEIQDNKYEPFIKMNEVSPTISSSNEETQAIQKAPTSEFVNTIENDSSSTRSEKSLETLVSSFETFKNPGLIFNDEKLIADSKNSLQTEYNINIYEGDESPCKNFKEINLADTAKADIDIYLKECDQEKCDVNKIAELHEENSSELCKTSYKTNGSNASIEIKSNTDSILKQTVNEVLEVLSQQDFDVINNGKDVINNDVKNKDNMIALEGSQTYCECDIDPVTSKAETKTDQKVSEIEISCINNSKKLQVEGTCDYVLPSVTSVPKLIEIEFNKDTEMCQQDFETYTEISTFKGLSSNSEKIASEIKNETEASVINEENLTLGLIECGLESTKSPEVLPSTDCEENMETSDVDCLTDKCVDIIKNNDKNEQDSSLSNKTLETKESCLSVSYKCDISNCHPKIDTGYLSNKMNIKHSIDKLVESRHLIETDLTVNDVIKCDKTKVNKVECISEIPDIKTFDEDENTLFSKRDNIACDGFLNENHQNFTSNEKCFLDLNKRVNASNIDFEKKSINVLNDLLDVSTELYSKSSDKWSRNYIHFSKELLSPRIQKLLIYTEGVCKSIKDTDGEGSEIQIKEIPTLISKKDVLLCNNYDSILKLTNSIDKEFPNDDKDTSSFKYTADQKITPFVSESEEHLTTNYNVSQITEIKHELSPARSKSNVINYSVAPIKMKHDDSDFISFNSCEDKLNKDHINQDNSFKQFNKKDSNKITGIFDSCSDMKPRKITKRSLSESALEEYNENIDLKLLRSRKRKKGNRSIVESPILTEDICNIIQTNRRNSISTFYNEDNLYIVIDNDLLLTNENDDSDKICYTEITDECSAGIESPNNMDDMIATDFSTDNLDLHCEYSSSLQNFEIDKRVEDSWVEDVACIETVFSEDVAENIIIDTHLSPKQNYPLNLENVDEDCTIFYDSDHIDKIKTIYGSSICDDNTELIETLYRTPQMNVNKTLYNIEYQESENCLEFQGTNNESSIESKANIDCPTILEIPPLLNEITCNKIIDDKENMSENSTLNCKQFNLNQNMYQNFSHPNDIDFKAFSTEEQNETLAINSCESNNDYVTLNVQKENSIYSCSSSPEVSSTTSEEKNSTILLKITNCNGSRVSQINEISANVHNKLSYKLTEKRKYQNYNSNFRTSRTLITKAAQKYIPPLEETIYDLKVKLPLPQHRLQTLKQLKITKEDPKITASTNHSSIKTVMLDKPRKHKPKFEDVLKSIDEINFKKQKNKVNKKLKNAIPKVLIKKNRNGAHYTTSEVTNTKESYNPDLTGRKWQPWVFLEKNKFIDGMVLQNKIKAVYCHRKNSFVLQEKFRRYKSVYNANFVISQPKPDISKKGDLKYTIRLKQI